MIGSSRNPNQRIPRQANLIQHEFDNEPDNVGATQATSDLDVLDVLYTHESIENTQSY